MIVIKAQLAALIFSLFITITSSTAVNFQIAKDGCDDHCGEVEIPFPFGIEEGCYLNSGGFKIDCVNSVPYWFPVATNLTITNISLEGHFRTMFFVKQTCYNESGRVGGNFVTTFDLGAPTFTLSSSSNMFVVIGCDDEGTFSGNDDKGVQAFQNGCMTFCRTLGDVTEDNCNGIGCCQSQIPSGQTKLEINLLSTYDHARVLKQNPCGHAFVIEKEIFKFSSANLTNLRRVTELPMVVDWVVGTINCATAKKNLTSYACKGSNTVCYEPPGDVGYRCACTPGFEGNPYLSGCTDIDECADNNVHKCVQESVCNNSDGDYTCNCKEGYEGDGKKDCTLIEKGGASDTSKYYKIVSGASVGAVFILVVGVLLYSEKRRRKLQQAREKFFRDNGGVQLQNQLSSNKSGHSTKIFSIDELKRASNNFDVSRIIGEGGFGTVYKGYLADNTVIAIKKSKAIDRNQIDSFINEVLVLSRINHRNVVKLLGCCLETETPLLVYEFVDNETLSEHIHDINKASVLSFQMRLKIAAESAGVLSYLHSAASPPIIHRDVKSANILLDKNYTAKVADFGISRINLSDQTQISTMVQGTIGYLDPEYMQTSQLTEKSDVYSFGVLLIELFTGKRVLSFDRPEEERCLASYFLSKLKNDTLGDILDGSISNEGTKELLDEIATLAKQCVNIIGEQRPTMKEVAMELEGMRLTKYMDFNLGKNVEEVEPFLFEGPSDSYIFDVNSITNASSSNEGMSDLFHAKNVGGR
ncbi:hypothetical protein Leryth_015878 [Lithospermum erythrorhizon]|nr:hypothetical protein Leryth_015878 [Lithospermum erythrorhizon]